MPTEKTLAYLAEKFQSLEKHYFGVFTFIAPFLSRFVGENKLKEIIDYLDKNMCILKKYLFKIVITAVK